MTTALHKLHQLGNSSQAIATSLRLANIMGKRHRPYACPINNFLLSIGYRNTRAGSHCIAVDYKTGEKLLTPPAIADFIRAFDAGKFPELVG